jgi:hypothetical protein
VESAYQPFERLEAQNAPPLLAAQLTLILVPIFTIIFPVIQGSESVKHMSAHTVQSFPFS